MKRLAIIGSSDLGQQISYHALNDTGYQPVGFFDDFQKAGNIRHGYPVLGGLDDIVSMFERGQFDEIIIAIGYKHMDVREKLFEKFAGKVPFASIIHSSSYVDKSCRIGRGVVIYPGCVLDMNVTIGDNVLLNTGCIIAHDSIINSHSFISPGVRVAGFVEIQKGVQLGIGTVVIDNILIESAVKTGAGAVVTKNIEEPGLYVGVPARFIKPL